MCQIKIQLLAVKESAKIITACPTITSADSFNAYRYPQ